MHVLPVLDLKGGLVVRGVAGRRAEYCPIVSRLTQSSKPAAVAAAFAEHFGLAELYLADLDAIAGAPPALDVYATLQARGFRLWVDAGVREWADAKRLADAGVATVVAGLETLTGPTALHDMVQSFGERIVFSLDLRDGVPLASDNGWSADVAADAVACGVRRIIVLDLARVGVGSGPGTTALCARLVAAYHPAVAVYAAGGVRGAADLRRLGEIGVRGALVASALHEGTLRRGDLHG